MFIRANSLTGLDMANFYEMFSLKNTLEDRKAPWESQTGRKQSQKGWVTPLYG